MRKHVMVRVGGGWDTLERYFDKHDPCKVSGKATDGATFFFVFVFVIYSLSHHVQETIQLLTLRTVQLLELLITRIFTLLYSDTK